MTVHPLPNRHPGLVPGSAGPLSHGLEPPVHDSRRCGSRHKAGMTKEELMAMGDEA
jgi:hypothetical protein